MARTKMSLLTFTPLLTNIFLLVSQIIPNTITQEALPSQLLESKLKSLSQNSPLGLEQAPAEAAAPGRYHIIAPPKYNHQPQDPQPLQIHRRAPHEHNLNLHYRKLDNDEIQNHQFLKPTDQETISRLYRKPQEEEILNRQYQKPADQEASSRIYRKPQEQEILNVQYQKPADQEAVSRLYRKPQEQEILNAQYQRPAEDPNAFNSGGQIPKQADEYINANRQYRKPQEDPESSPDAPENPPTAHPDPPAAPHHPPAAPEHPPVAHPEPPAAPENPPSATIISPPPKLPKEAHLEFNSMNISEQQLKDQKMELLKLIDQVGFDKAVHIFDNRIKSELNPKGSPPTNQQSTNVRNNVIKNITTYHIYKPLKPLIEVIAPPTTTTTLKPQFPDNVESPIDSEYQSEDGDDQKTTQDEQQEARQSREENPSRKAHAPAQNPNPVARPTKKPTHIPLPPHQDKPKTNPVKPITTTTATTTTRRTPPQTRPQFQKASPKFSPKPPVNRPIITEAPTTNNQTHVHGGCPSFLEFRLGAVILWENLKQANNIFGGIHLIVEAMVEAMKSLGLCFFAIGSDVVEAINNFFTVENDPSESDPERNFLNSSRV